MARVCAEKASGSAAGPYDAPGLYGQGGRVDGRLEDAESPPETGRPPPFPERPAGG